MGVAPDVAAPATPTFGTDALSFVSLVEAHGSFALVHQFDEDTNRDGTIDPKFGDHGEPEGDWPTVWLYPLPIGPGERFDEFITSDPTNRWVVLRRGTDLVAVSASQRWSLDDADVTPDPSPCAAARQATIDPTSTWLTFTRAEPPRAVVKSLITGVEREVPAEGLLWRADAMPRGWVMLREILADADGDGAIKLPWRQGTCICRWCSRFASSVGSGRLVGDESRDTMVDAAGRRSAPPPMPIPLEHGAIWSMSKNALFDADGAQRPIADGCSMRMLPMGTDRIVANCRGKFVVWSAATDQTVAIEAPVTGLQTYSPPTEGWVGVQFTDEEGVQRVGRLGLGDGRIDAGPPAVRWGAPHPSGWRLIADAEHVYAWDVRTGTTTTLNIKGAELDGLVAKRGNTWFVIDPTKPVAAAQLTEAPSFVAANGCYVKPHPFNQPVRGPFEWVCQ